MKQIRILFSLLAAVLISGVITGQDSEEIRTKVSNLKIVTEKDSLSYALALMNYYSLANDNIILEPLIFAKAMLDAENGNPILSEEASRNYLMAFANKRQAKQAELDREANKVYIESNISFLTQNRSRAGIVETSSGLQYEVVIMGSGARPTRDDIVKVHYTGKLIDGTEFDSSIKRNTPAQFPLAGVIPGWTEGLQLMPAGSKFIFYIPEKLGYGSRGAGDVIKPYSTLIFEVELLEIVR